MIWITAALGLVGLGIFAVFWEHQTPWFRRANGAPANIAPPSSTPGLTSSATAREKTTKLSAAQRLQFARSELQSSANAEESRKILADLHAYLKSLPPEMAAAVITGFLANSAADATTHIEFAIGNNGSLSGQPTLRVALLDWLGEIDPQQAGVVAKRILSTPTAADEWAVCLRNYARAYPGTESNDFLRAKTEELIANPAWQAEPSIGYLNSFDVLVHTRATASTPLLSSLIQRKDRKDLAHAGFLTLDRLVQRNPSDVLTRLATDTALTQSRPEMVAQQFARADLRDPVQQEIVKNWLLDPTRTATELRSFAGVYPNNNRFVSNNLLTSETQQTGADLAEHDRAALEIIKSWSEDPAFEPVKSHITAIHQRLTTFVNPSTQ